MDHAYGCGDQTVCVVGDPPGGPGDPGGQPGGQQLVGLDGNGPNGPNFSGTPGGIGGVPLSGNGNNNQAPNNGWDCSVLNPNSHCTLSKLKELWKKNWDCVANVGWPVLENDLNPFSLGVGTAADATSQASQASLQAAATWSVERGLTVPLRSSIVRAGVGTSEALGRLSVLLTATSVLYAETDAIIAEHKGCKL